MNSILSNMVETNAALWTAALLRPVVSLLQRAAPVISRIVAEVSLAFPSSGC